MGTMTENQYLDLEANIQKYFDAFYKNNMDYVPKMFNVIKSQRARELHQGFGTVGRMANWNGTVFYDNIDLGYDKEYRPGKKSLGLAIDKDLYEDKEYEEIKRRVNEIAYGVHKTLQADAASVFNNAFSTAITGPDGVALCSATHHLVPGDDAQSNTNTLDLSVDNLETVLNAMRDFKDNRGDIMDVEGNLIICGTYWAKTAKQLIGSDKEAYTADNQINAYDGLTYLVNPRITGKKWFVANKTMMLGGSGLNWVMRKDPRNLERDSDFDTEILKWKAVGRWAYGWDMPMFIYGNNPV